MNKGLKLIVPGLALAMAAGCGGGGGGGNSGPAPTTMAVISGDNATDLSGDVLEGIEDTADLGDFADVSDVGFATSAGTPDLAKASLAVAGKSGPEMSKGLRTMLYAAFEIKDAPCEGGGTASITVDVASQDQPSAGDFLEFTFDNCAEGDGETVDGRIAMRVQSFSGDYNAGLFRMGVRVTFDRLTVTESAERGVIDGAIDLVQNTEDYPVLAASHSGDLLSLTDGVHTVEFEDWITAVTADESSFPAAYTWDASGTINVPEHGGTVTYNVLETFTGFGDGEPDSGKLYIEGEGGGNITLTVLAQDQIQVDVDEDGDGVIDESYTVTRNELEG